MEQSLIKQIKSSIAGIGLRKKDTNYYRLFGTGFFIHPRGSLMTARHVLDDCLKSKPILEEKEDCEIQVVAIHLVSTSTNWKVKIREITEFIFPVPLANQEGFGVPEGFDVALGQVNNQQELFNFLTIQHEGSLQISEKIGICGYPRPSHSFSLIPDQYNGVRLSPLIQFGQISSLLPTDDMPLPYGLQTDIISFGGASGSPMFSQETGKVIGIAQKIIPSYAQVSVPENIQEDLKGHKNFDGFAHLGLVHGNSFHMIRPLQDSVKDGFSTTSGQVIGADLSHMGDNPPWKK